MSLLTERSLTVVDQLCLANPLSLFLNKERQDFTREDMLRVITQRGIERISFHYTGIDGQLKELGLPISSLAHAERILAMGERVDGSSLFKGMVETSTSDLYVVPSYQSAFINPFDPRRLSFICRFLDRNGEFAPFPPENILRLAHRRFRETTGMELHALGELEFYLISEGGLDPFAPKKQRGYHATAPFFKSGDVVNEMVRLIAQITGAVKYAHAEVGFIDALSSDEELLDGKRAEQHEIEFLTRPIDDMGDYIAIAKWIVRNVAYRNGMLATFSPKLQEGVAGSGLHFHMELVKEGQNMMTRPDGSLSDEALQLIGGVTHYASTLSAFGNTEASSFLRLVPNQEAPTRICWSHSNRSALIRVPLGWTNIQDLSQRVNPNGSATPYKNSRSVQTVELRSPDGSALFHLLLAGLTTAAEYGLTTAGMKELALRSYVEGDIFKDKELLARLEALPGSCVACANLLEQRREMYDKFGVFPASVLNYVIKMLRMEEDENLNREINQMPAEERLALMHRVMHRDIHRH
jgi:glutamine synthetase